jgi:hypothetical protein
MKVSTSIGILALVSLVAGQGCRSVVGEHGKAVHTQTRDVQSACEVASEPPSSIREDPKDLALVNRLKKIQPNILIKKMEEIPDLSDGDVISAIVLSVPEEPGIYISYRANNTSWNYRQAIPTGNFAEFLKGRPDVYECLCYVVEHLHMPVFCLETQNEVRIFMLDQLSGERENRMLPKGIRILPGTTRW